MNTSIKDYNFQNIVNVHNFVLIFLIFVLVLVLVYFLYAVIYFNITLKNCIALNIHKISKENQNWYLKALKVYKNLKNTHNIGLELIWTIIPIWIILGLMFPSLSLISFDDQNKKSSIYTVSVIGNQWYWNYELNMHFGIFKYVSNLEPFNWKERDEKIRLLTTTTALQLPVGIATSFYITSNDVAHSWSIPGLGIKVDAIPGRINLKNVVTSRIGLFSGMCSELCGIEHGFMPISVEITTFSNFLRKIKKINYNNNVNNFWSK